MMKEYVQKYYDLEHKKKKNNYGINTEDINLSTKLRIKRINQFISSGKDILELSVISMMPWWKRNKVILADISKGPLSFYKSFKSKRFDFNKKFPFDNNSFDVVVAVEVIEHLYNAENAIFEAFRCLRDGGIFVGSVPNEYHIRKRIEILFGKDVFGYGYHLSHFNKKSLRKLLRTKFNNVLITGYGPGVLCPSLLSSNLIFICKK